MKVTLVLFAAAAAVMAQSSDTVRATASGVCEPHDDHWHCPQGVPEPTSPPNVLAPSPTTPGASSITSSASHDDDDHDHDHDHAASASICEPHGDHWHCPSGVPEPTAKPEALASTCSPHGDHWHCPSGVAEPASPPAASTTGGNAGAGAGAAGASASASPSPTTGAAVKVRSGALAVVGAVGAWFL